MSLPLEELEVDIKNKGTIAKKEYMAQLPDMNKHDLKVTVKKRFFKFLDKNPNEKYFRLEIQDSPFGCNFNIVATSNREQMKENFYSEVKLTVEDMLQTVKAFDFVSDDNDKAMEIWGYNYNNEPIVLFLYCYGEGVIEIGDGLNEE